MVKKCTQKQSGTHLRKRTRKHKRAVVAAVVTAAAPLATTTATTTTASDLCPARWVIPWPGELFPGRLDINSAARFKLPIFVR